MLILDRRAHEFLAKRPLQVRPVKYLHTARLHYRLLCLYLLNLANILVGICIIHFVFGLLRFAKVVLIIFISNDFILNGIHFSRSIKILFLIDFLRLCLPQTWRFHQQLVHLLRSVWFFIHNFALYNRFIFLLVSLNQLLPFHFLLWKFLWLINDFICFLFCVVLFYCRRSNVSLISVQNTWFGHLAHIELGRLVYFFDWLPQRARVILPPRDLRARLQRQVIDWLIIFPLLSFVQLLLLLHLLVQFSLNFLVLQGRLVELLLQKSNLPLHLFWFQFQYSGMALDGIDFRLHFLDLLFRLGRLPYSILGDRPEVWLHMQLLSLLVFLRHVLLHRSNVFENELQLLLDSFFLSWLLQ